MGAILRHPRGGAGGEQGFGMLEAVIAGLLLLMIGAALSTTVVGTVRTQGKSARTERQLAVAEGLFERLKSDSEWAGAGGAGCNTMALAATQIACSSAWLHSRYAADGLADQSGTERPVRYDPTISISGIDDGGDGVGSADQDGMRPDYYSATVSVRRVGAPASEKAATLTGNIDPPGRLASGAISINVCKVKRQWDERIPVAACPEAHEVLLGYPAGGIAGAFGGTLDPHAQIDWNVALNRAGTSGGWFGWKMVTYDVEPANSVTVQLRRVVNGSFATVRASGFTAPAGCSSPNTKLVTCVSSAATPIRRVTGLIPGTYNVSLASVPNGYEAWPLQSIPSGNTAIVEAGRTSRALQVIKPRDRANYSVSLRSCDHTRVMTYGTGPCINQSHSTVSGYLAPAASARAHWSFDSSQVFGQSGIESAPGGSARITFNGLAPGLYTPRIVTGSQTSRTLTSGPSGGLSYIWLDPPRDGLGADVPASGVPTYTQHWCDYAGRVAYLAGVGLGSDGGTITRTGYVYKTVTNLDGTTSTVVDYTYPIYDVYYSADDYCKAKPSSGGGPPGPGGGGQ